MVNQNIAMAVQAVNIQQAMTGKWKFMMSVSAHDLGSKWVSYGRNDVTVDRTKSRCRQVVSSGANQRGLDFLMPSEGRCHSCADLFVVPQ